MPNTMEFIADCPASGDGGRGAPVCRHRGDTRCPGLCGRARGVHAGAAGAGRVACVRRGVSARQAEERTLARKAGALRASARRTPGDTDIQRGRAAMLEAYEQPRNLPPPEFARLASKVRQQIYKDITAGRLLALNVGPRGRKLPDWQLDPIKQRLTQVVLQAAVPCLVRTARRARGSCSGRGRDGGFDLGVS
jgi:hypothetical protein